MNIFNNSEYDYLQDIQTTPLINLVLGVKGSGKTTFIINLLKFILANRSNTVYTCFCLVIPNLKTDQNYSNEYRFLEKLPNVYIYNEYNLYSLNHIEHLHNKGERIFWVIDDATSSFQKSFGDKKFAFLNKIVTESRHVKICMFIIAHTLAKAFSPLVRTLCDFIFVYRINNSKLLEYIYYEFVSLNERYIDNRKLFFSDYSKLMKKKYSCMFINNRTGEIHTDVSDWLIMKLIDNKEIDKLIQSQRE